MSPSVALTPRYRGAALAARRRLTLLAVGIATAAAVLNGVPGLGSAAQAGSLQIQFSGLNLDYDGTNLYDSGVHNTTGTGNPAESDVLSTMSFFLDGNPVGTVLTSSIFADVYLAGIVNIPVGGGVINSLGNGGTFGIDLLTNNSTPGWGLALNINTMQFYYSGSQIAIAVSGLASSLAAQALPFDLEFDPNQPITIVFASAELTNVTNDGVVLTGFNAAGTGNVAGTGMLVPEPATALTMSIAILSLLAVCRHRRTCKSSPGDPTGCP